MLQLGCITKPINLLQKYLKKCLIPVMNFLIKNHLNLFNLTPLYKL